MLVTSVRFAADPAKLRVAARACHMIAGAVLGDRDFAIDALCD